jgi:Tfp pilus assembly protein PilN
VLAMIEINLLPPEYRPRETTNIPLIATILGGVVVVCGLFFYWMSVNGQVAELTRKNADLAKQKTDLEAEAKKIDTLREEIERQKSRQETIIEISQSKVMWSQKLEQLAQILGQQEFKNRFWITSLTLVKAGGRAGATSTLAMKVSGIGYDMREVAKLRDAIQQDQNFFYHFVKLESFTVNRKDLTVGKYRNATELMDFEIKLPVQSGTPAAAARGAAPRGRPPRGAPAPAPAGR